MAICQLLAGFGIYLGRWGRWNSWHILSKPWILGQAVWQSSHDTLAIKLTLVYGFVLLGLYGAFRAYCEAENRNFARPLGASES